MAVTKKAINAGPFVIREIVFEKSGDIVDLHTHNFDHVGLAVTAEVEIEVIRTARRQDGSLLTNNGEPVWLCIGKHRLIPGMWRNIEKGDRHKITCIVPGKFLCQFPHRDHEGNVVDHWRGNEAQHL